MVTDLVAAAVTAAKDRADGRGIAELAPHLLVPGHYTGWQAQQTLGGPEVPS